MKLIASNGSELVVKKYSPPTKFTAGEILLNGEKTEVRQTGGRGKSYSYFPVNGISLYVEGLIGGAPAEGEEAVTYTLEIPEAGLTGPVWTEARKSYYVRKRPAKPGEGETPAGANEVPGGGPAATTDPVTGEAVISEVVEGDAAAPEGDNPLDGVESTEQPIETEAPKARRRK